MVKAKIYTGQSHTQEIQQAFRDEMKGIMNDASLKMKCPVEQLKFRFDNLGRVEVQMMTADEMIEKQKENNECKRIAVIRNRRNNVR